MYRIEAMKRSFYLIKFLAICLCGTFNYASPVKKEELAASLTEKVSANLACESNNDCGNGICNEESKFCECQLGFVSFGENKCSYVQKNKVYRILFKYI